MKLFKSKTKPIEEPLYKTSFGGFWIRVYSNRVDFKAGAGSESVPINQIASVHLAVIGIMKITLETTGGKKYNIPTHKKKEVQQAIYQAQARLTKNSSQKPTNTDELIKLNELREKGIISQDEFDLKKKQILGI